MKLSLLVGLIVISLVVSLSFVSAAALIRTDLEKNVLVADGITEYRLDIWADNTGLNGDVTDGIQWTVLIPAELQNYMTVTRAERPVQNDFFGGSSMFWQQITTGMYYQTLLVNQGQGKSNAQGYLATYYFTLSPGFAGRTQFDMSDVIFTDPTANEQGYMVENEQFTVLRSKVVTSAGVSRCVGQSC